MDIVDKFISYNQQGVDVKIQNDLLNSLKEINEKSLKDKNNREKINKSWNENNENVDLDLLKSQLLGFNLLSHDVDLPIELDLEYVNPNYNEEEVSTTNVTNDNDNDNKITLPLDD